MKIKLIAAALLLVPFMLSAKEVAHSEGTAGTAYLTDEKCPWSAHPDLAYAYGINKITGKKDIEACWVLYDNLVVFLVPNQEPVAFDPKAFTWKEVKL